MRKNDYNPKKTTDLSKLLPDYIKSDVLEGLSNNILNRFLTKSDFSNFNGYVGQIDERTELSKLPERSAFRSKNQLQPVASNKNATETDYMSFQDFLRRLERMGVDIEDFNEWGNSLQFNWVPPVDIDKLINYQDYYWDSTQTPQYITIKNRKNQLLGSFDELKSSFFRRFNKKPAQTLEDILSNTNSTHVIFFSPDTGTPVIARIESNPTPTMVEVEYDSDFSTPPIVNDFVELDFPLVNTVDNVVTVNGDFSDAELEQLIIALYDDIDDFNEYAKVTGINYVESQDITEITLDEIPSGNYSYISFHPTLFSEMFNIFYNSAEVSDTYDNLNATNASQALWLSKNAVVSSNNGITALGSPILQDTSLSTDFTQIINTNKKYYVAISNGINKGLYEVLSFTAISLTIDGYFFESPNISYKLLERTEFQDIQEQHDTNLYDNYVFYSGNNDTLFKYNESTSSYQPIVSNFSLLIEDSNITTNENTNKWIEENSWIHKNQVKSFAGKIQAKMPIIEYEAYLELSDSASITYQWRYSRSDNNPRYRLVDATPNLLEIQPIKLDTPDILLYNLEDPNTLNLPPRFGNLENHVKIGDKLIFSEFSSNNGAYTVNDVSFIVPTNGRPYTRIQFSNIIPDETSIIAGSSTVYPEKTSQGDTFDIDYDHWEFAGIKSINASSIDEAKNPMLDIKIGESYETFSDTLNGTTISRTYQTILGLSWQEFVPSLTNVIYSGASLMLDSSLHDLCLYEDYQEGDIRVYINGERQYGNFQEIPDSTGLYVAGITFDNNVEITIESRIRVEVGEYFKKDIGKRAIKVKTKNSHDIFNLVDDRKQEQEKNTNNQYPLFRVYDVFGNPQRKSNSIFRFKEDRSFRIDKHVGKRIVKDEANKDFTFENLLFKDDDPTKMLCYKDFTCPEKVKSVWRVGNNKEQQIPQKVGDDWDIPNSWYFNLNHDNYKSIRLTELFRHFRTIIDYQNDPKFFGNSGAPTSYFHGMQKPNYGIAGTIKEHNDGLDILASIAFVENINPIDVFEFVERIYDSQISHAIDSVLNNINLLLEGNLSELEELLINSFENNKKYDQWFGDSSAWNGETGIKGFISSSAITGITKLYDPTILTVNGKTYIRHHDGHVSQIEINNTTKVLYLKNIIQGQQTVKNNADALPSTTEYDLGDYVLRLITKTKELKLLENTPTGWKEIQIENMVAELILKIEKRLFDIAKIERENSPKFYNFSQLETKQKFSEYEKEYFIKWFNEKSPDLLPLENNIFNPNDPFTWNYSFSTINQHPITGNAVSNLDGSWQALYESLFGTPYPHREPWKLQGYENKPIWWDDQYRNNDPLLDRPWTISMWNNIISGIIPTGYELPNGNTSSGTSGETTQYLYLPVNILNTATDDGYNPDDLLPPFWNSNNSPATVVKTPFRKELSEYINAPSAPFLFGKNGYDEWEWRASTNYLSSLLKIAFRLDPMRFVHKTFGNTYVNADCLQVDSTLERVYSHSDTIFHGDIVGDTTVFKSAGLLEWLTHYNRYIGFDGESSRYRQNWKEWDINLSYLFDNIIGTESIEVRNESLDITERDYDIGLKNTGGIEDFWFKAINVTSLRSPAAFIDNKEKSKDWILRLLPLSPKDNIIDYYLPENFPFRKISDSEFKIYNHEILKAGISEPVGYFDFIYDKQLFGGTVTQLQEGQQYSFTINSIDGQSKNETVTLNIDSAITTVDTVLNQINAIAEDYRIKLVNGNLRFESSTNGINSSIIVSDNGLFATLTNSLVDTQSSQTNFIFEKYFEIKLSEVENILKGQEIEIVDSTNFNGSYTIKDIFVDLENSTYRIFVEEDVSLLDSIVDGYIVPSTARTLPWETGQEVFFNTTGVLPNNLLDYVPYYIIKIDDFTFQIAESEQHAKNGKFITSVNDGAGSHKIGRVRNTFKALSGQSTDYAWRRHFVDKREEYRFVGPYTISTLQNLIDSLFGYYEYLEDIGIFSENAKLDNVDEDTSRANDWQLEIEKLLDWLFNIIKIKEERFVSVEAEIDENSDSLKVLANTSPWKTGDQVIIEKIDGTLPTAINTGFNNFIPFYVIKNPSGTTIQLASSRDKALTGSNISFRDGTGTVRIKSFKKLSSRPNKVINPYKKQFNIRHELGLPTDFTRGSDLSIISSQRIYDQNLEDMTVKDLLFFRNDKESKIKTVDNSKKEIYGGHVFLDGVEHIIKFNNYSTDGRLIYDPFLGIATPRFFLEFVKPNNITQRSSTPGFIINDDQFTSNIEKAIDDIRYYYDSYRPFETDATTISARESVGYEGRSSYMDALGVNAKSQFIFWKGYIQSKGSKKALDAFTNHRLLNNISVDEFWSYRLCSFGDSKLKIYPELNLFTEDVIEKELRLEFSPPTGGILGGPDFTQIRLTDRERWNNQPDIIEALAPYESYFFNVAPIEIIENVETVWITSPTISTYTDITIPLSRPTDAAIIQYTDSSGKVKYALEQKDFEFSNSYTIRIINSEANTWSNVNIVTYTYSYKEEQPAKIIDKTGIAKVVADVPIWNPAFDQHNPLGKYPIDLTQPDDPAIYSTESNNFWSNKEVGTVWFDNSLAFYKPYYDKRVYPSLDERSLYWGNLSEFGDIMFYQWIETNIPPDEYDDISERQELNQDIPLAERITGQTKKDVHKNTTVGWVKDETIVITVFPESYLSSSLQPILDKMTELEETSVNVSVYKNGTPVEEITIQNAGDVDNYMTMQEFDPSSHLAFVKHVHTPTEDEIDNETYRLHIPHTVVTEFNNKNNELTEKYYYWVRNLKNEKMLNNTSLTLFDAEKEMREMNRPYMFLEGVRYEGVGYGILFSSTFDPDDNNLPLRYTQCIVKGLEGRVKDNNRYVLRFLKDYTLRDQLEEDSLNLQNKHWEWKLFRKNQPFKVDPLLWHKLIESAVGYSVSRDDYVIDFNTQVPSLERVTFDTFVENGSSSIGLKDDQVLAERTLVVDTIVSTLLDENRWKPKSDIIDDYDINDPESLRDMLVFIYETLTDSEVNEIFFEILEESMISRKEHPDFFKTSWVSIDVEAELDINPPNKLSIPQVFPNGICFLNGEEQLCETFDDIIIQEDVVICTTIECIIPEYCTTIECILPEFCADIECIIPEYCTTIECIPIPEYCTTIECILPEYCTSIECIESSPLELVYDTTMSAGTTIELTAGTTTTDPAEIHWGDGVREPLPQATVTTISHTYATEGQYTVRIYGNINTFRTPNQDKLIRCTSFGDSTSLTTLSTCFSGAVNLIEVPTSLPPTVTHIDDMFGGATSFVGNELSNWNTSNVRFMSSTFENATAFNGNISSWDTSSVENAADMFFGATSFNQDLPNWDFSGINSFYPSEISRMFRGATSFNGDVSGWNVSTVKNFSFMFSDTPFNRDLSSWNVSSATDMSYMFTNASAFNQDISLWNVSLVTDMRSMFSGATAFNQDIGSWNVSSVTSMTYMFLDATSFNQDLSGWCVTNITSQPFSFDSNASSWVLPRPVWGTCP